LIIDKIILLKNKKLFIEVVCSIERYSVILNINIHLSIQSIEI